MSTSRFPPPLAALVALVVLLAAAAPALADGPFTMQLLKLDASDYPTLRIAASVVDAAGKPAQGIAPKEIVVYEQGLEQKTNLTITSEVAPVEIALVLDTGVSQRSRPAYLVQAKSAISTMIQRLGPNDRAALITFSTSVRVVQALTGSKTALLAATQAATAGGETALYDAMVVATDALKDQSPRARSAIVLLTDGFDNASRIGRDTAVARLASAGHPVFAIGVGDEVDRATLEALAAAVRGGKMLNAPNPDQLSAVYGSLSEQFATGFTILYRSNATVRDGTVLTVRLRFARDGAPPAEVSSTYTVPAGRGVVGAPPPVPIEAGATTPQPPRVEAMPPEPTESRAPLVGVLGGAAAFLILLAFADITARGPKRERRRLRAFVPRAAPEEDVWAIEPVRPLRERMRSVLAPVGQRFANLTPSGLVSSTGQRLEQAGAPLGLQPVEFLGLRAASAVLGSLLLTLLLWLATAPVELVAVGVPGGIVLGYTLPEMAITRMIRRRKTEILRVLPSSLDMLALSVEAGLAFDGAIAQVAQRRQNALAEEFRRLLVEFQMGRQRKQALREMARRTGAPEVARLTNAVIQADALGAPLAKVFHDLAAEFRTKRRQRAEELARTAPIKMLFPMILLIFPALFVVILGPAVPRLMAVFGSH